MSSPDFDTDVLILGGGIAGLWVLHELGRRGLGAILVERRALGAGQTVWSQGIIHGGLKYTLSGLMSGSARAIRDMPGVWRRCLAGEGTPDLRAAPVRSDHCVLWRTDSLASRAGMLGARVGLRVAPVLLTRGERPLALAACPGEVARLDEQVIDPRGVLAALATPQQERIIQGELVEARQEGRGVVALVRCGPRTLRVEASTLVLTAGNGTPELRAMLGLAAGRTQVRPLRMLMVRGEESRLPALFGHCVDGSRTRVTITSALHASGERVWQIGGEAAEMSMKLDARDAMRLARREVLACIPGLDLSGCAWGWYDAPRAESATQGGARPEDAVVLEEGAILTAWPTKLALAPRLATLVGERCAARAGDASDVLRERGALEPDWPRPMVAPAPWDEFEAWAPDTEVA